MNEAQPTRRTEANEQQSFDELWRATFYTYYDCFYNELVADRLIDRWQLVDDCTKVLVAITASTSALSGWALWSQPGYKVFWMTLAGLSALLAIVHTSLTVAHRLRDWGEIKRSFAGLRIELETLRFRMRFDFEATVKDFKNEFKEYRRRYLEVVPAASK